MKRVWKPLILKTSITPPPIDEPTISASRVLPADLDAHRVRMHVAEVFLGEVDVHAHLLGDADRLGDARIVDVQADRAADQREVGAVSAIRRRERRMEEEVHVDRILVEDLARHAAEARGAGGMRAGRSDHHRAHHVENRDFAVVANGH